MREDYTFYNCYCNNNDPIDFKACVLNELRNLNYFPWLRDEPRNGKRNITPKLTTKQIMPLSALNT